MEEIDKQPWRQIPEDAFSVETADRYLQYRAIFKSDNGDRYPILDRVTITLAP
ncbi:hypothetical protein MYX78_02160 [Acidobacteria bacterium AH-259-G07]|nr:hypothetical protein [Acidobacteria bacterium AH-259-G07]